MINDIKNFLKHSSIYAIGNIINRIGAFLLLPVYTNFLTLGEYGALELIYSTQAIIASLLSMGFAHSTLRFYFEYDEEKEKQKVISTIFLGAFIISVIGVLLVSPFSKFLSQFVFDDDSKVSYFYVVYVILVFEISFQIQLAYLRAKLYSIQYVVVSLIKFLIQVTFNSIAVIVFKAGIMGILLGNLLSIIFCWVFLSYLLIKENGIKFDFEKLKIIWKYAFPLLLSTIGAIILNNVDKYLLKYFVSLEAVGIYGLALKLTIVMKELYAEPFNKNFSPYRFSIMKKPDRDPIISKITSYFIMGYLLLGLGIIFFMKDILQIMSKEEYWAAVSLIPILVLAHIFNGLNYIFQTGILYSKKTKYLFYTSTLSGVLAIILNVILIKMFKDMGAALSQLLIAAIIMMITYHISQKTHFIRYDIKILIKLLALFGVAIGMYYYMPSVENIYVGISLKLLILFLFILSLLGFKIIRKEEKILLNSFLSKILIFFRR